MPHNPNAGCNPKTCTTADAQIAPDGSRVAYPVTQVSADRKRNVTHIWLVSTSGGESQQLTKDDTDDSNPHWSPDGKWIAFYKQDGLWMASPDSGAAQMVTRGARTNFFFNKASESFPWSPDSQRLAFLSDATILPPANPMTERLRCGVDVALEKFPFLDKDRMDVMGGRAVI